MTVPESKGYNPTMTPVEGKGCWVYIAELGEGRLYVGITNDPERRAIEHRLGKSIRTTRIFGFRQVLYTECHPTLQSARKREQQIKGWTRAKKLALASGNLRDLKALFKSKTPKRREQEQG